MSLAYAFIGTGFLMNLIAMAAWLIILIHAFRTDTLKGVLSLVVPFYVWYYAFAYFEHEKKSLVVGVFLGCGIVSLVLMLVGIWWVFRDIATMLPAA